MQTIGIVAAKLSGRGGTETVIQKLVNSSLLQNNFSFEIFASDGIRNDRWIDELNPRVKVMLNDVGKFGHFFKKILFFITSRDDFLFILGPKAIFLARIIKTIFRKKYKIISWIQFSVENVPFINPKLLKYADFHFAISSDIKQQLVNRGIKESKIFTIYDPVSKSKQIIKRSLPNEPYQFIYIGRIMLDGQKNMREIFDVLSLLRLNKKIHLKIIGSGDEINKCKKYAYDLFHNNHNVCIEWCGWQNHPWDIIKRADLLLLSSKYEGFGMVLAEAISRGVPCVSSNCPVGPQDIIKCGENGELYNPGDIQQFSESIKLVLRNEKSRCISKIKKSINCLYEEKYFERVRKSIDHINTLS